MANWISKITKLAEFAVTQPQASFAEYTFGLKQWWTYFLRTLPDIQDLLETLESAISRVLIPAITDRQCGQLKALVEKGHFYSKVNFVRNAPNFACSFVYMC